MKEYSPNYEKWSVYESNMQAYRGNFLSSQSFLLAVGAITIEKNMLLTLGLAIIAIYQIWFIWVKSIYIRTQIVDYHKYAMNTLFDEYGNEKEGNENVSELSEHTYTSNRSVRSKVYDLMSKKWNRSGKFRTMRRTRFEFDILIPASITLIWGLFIYVYWM